MKLLVTPTSAMLYSWTHCIHLIDFKNSFPFHFIPYNIIVLALQLFFFHSLYKNNTIALTLCGDLARNEWHLLEEQLLYKPIIALLKAKITTYASTYYKLNVIYFFKHLYHVYVNHWNILLIIREFVSFYAINHHGSNQPKSWRSWKIQRMIYFKK